MKRIKILLVEDNRMLRDGIRDLINAQSDLTVVSSTGGGHNTVQLVKATKPNVILMDLGLRSEHAARIVSAILREQPDVRIIGMGLIPSQLDVVEFVEVGAAGFILKDATVEEVLQTIRLVAKGSKVLPPPLTGSLFSHVVDRALERGKGSLTSAVRMTKREREVIALIAEGMSNKQIAEELDLSTYTVKSHIHNILEKLALQSRLQIASHFRYTPPR